MGAGDAPGGMGRRRGLGPSPGSAVRPWRVLAGSLTVARGLVFSALVSSPIRWCGGVLVMVRGLPLRHRAMHLAAESRANLPSREKVHGAVLGRALGKAGWASSPAALPI